MPNSVTKEICKLLSWNLWSIKDKYKLANFLQVLEDNEISIACICETWFNREKGTFTKSIKDAGYQIIHSFREEKRGGGTAIIFKENLSIKKGSSSSDKYFKQLKDSRRTLILCIYRKQEISIDLFCSVFEA